MSEIDLDQVNKNLDNLYNQEKISRNKKTIDFMIFSIGDKYRNILEDNLKTKHVIEFVGQNDGENKYDDILTILEVKIAMLECFVYDIENLINKQGV